MFRRTRALRAYALAHSASLTITLALLLALPLMGASTPRGIRDSLRQLFDWGTTYPVVRSVSFFTATVGSPSSFSPFELVAGDLLVTVVETANGAEPAATGWTALPDGSSATGADCVATPATTCARVFVLYRVADGVDDTISLNDTGDHTNYATFAVMKDTFDPVTPFDTTVAATSQVAGTAVSITGFTADRPHSMIVVLSGAALPDATTTSTEWSAITYGNTLFPAIRLHNTSVQGLGGGILLLTSLLSEAGPTGTFTATAATSSVRVHVVFAIHGA